MARQTALVFFLIAVATALAALRNAGATSPDLLATWMAGLHFARDTVQHIYPALGPVFEMQPPDAWVPELRAQGHEASIYPFIYPPLWAWVASGLTQVMEYATLVSVMNVVNPVLLGLTLWLAARLAGKGLSPVAYVGIGLAVFASTTISLVALEQNQPQILVAFLTVLAIERAHGKSPTSAGIALALAASIKLYPALFALFWLVRGERRAVASFALVGGALGVASIAVAGWPLHAEFLGHVRAISSTVLVTSFTHSIDPVIGDMFFSGQMTVIPDNGGTGAGWHVMAKPALWKALNAVALLAALVALARLVRRTDDPLFWPLAFAVISLLGPLSWGYHYLAVIVFLPALLARMRPAYGILTILAVLFPTSVFYTLNSPDWLPFEQYANMLGTAAMAAFALICLSLIRRRDRAPETAMAPAE